MTDGNIAKENKSNVRVSGWYNKGIPHMTQGKTRVKIEVFVFSDVQTLFDLSPVPVLFPVQDSSIIPINPMTLLSTVYSIAFFMSPVITANDSHVYVTSMSSN